jgi:hypothetical protein
MGFSCSVGGALPKSYGRRHGLETGSLFCCRPSLAVQAFSLSLTALAGVKASFRAAAIWIGSPVAGLRPSRAGVALTLNLPNPLIETSSYFEAASAIAEKPHPRSCAHLFW